MAKKKNSRTVSPSNAVSVVRRDAIAIRSHAAANGVVLFDGSELKSLSECGFDPMEVAWLGTPKKFFDQLRRRSGRGRWLAIQSSPEILDSDGVPWIDLVFRRPSSKTAEARISPPKKGKWLEPGSHFLDLPSGKLRIVTSQEYFSAEGGTQQTLFVVEKSKPPRMDESDHWDSDSYELSCAAGYYQVDWFARDPADAKGDNGAADLVIYLTPTKKPSSFRLADAVQRHSITTAEPNKVEPTTQSASRLLPDGSYEAELKFADPWNTLAMSESMRKQMGIFSGCLVKLQFNRQVLHGCVVKDLVKKPKAIEALVSREKRKHKNYVMLQYCDDYLWLTFVKKSRTEPLNFKDKSSYKAVLTVES